MTEISLIVTLNNQFTLPWGTFLCSNCWDQIPRTCHVFTRLFTSNTPWYFLDFAPCSLRRMKLVVQFPARGSTQVLLCLLPGVLWLWHFLYIVSVHIQRQASIYTLSLCCGHSWRVRLAKQETLTPPGYLVTCGLQGSVNVHRGALLLVPSPWGPGGLSRECVLRIPQWWLLNK